MKAEKNLKREDWIPLFERGPILWRLFRPHTLTASFIPVMLGTVFAWYLQFEIHYGLFIAMLAASVLIQAATNMFNEYFDYQRGLDNEESVGIAGAITRDGIKAVTVLRIAWISIAIACLIGIYIILSSSWLLLPVGVVCILVGYLYTGGPYPIAYTPFGELLAGLFMGSGIILISFFIQTGFVSLAAFLFSVPSLILIGAILMANNIRDRIGDEKSGRRTLAILLGHRKAVRFLGGMFVVTYLWTFLLIGIGILPISGLLTLLSLPYAFKAVFAYRHKQAPAEMVAAMKAVAQTNTMYGLLLVIGLML